MAIGGKFNRPVAGQQSASAGARKSRYSGIQDRSSSEPFLELSDGQRFRLKSLTVEVSKKTRKEYHKAVLVPVRVDGDHYAEGADYQHQMQFTNPGLSELKDLIRNLAGFEDKEEFNAFDGEDGRFIDHCVGTVMPEFEGLTIVGRLVDLRVVRGAPSGPDDFFRNIFCAVVTDEEQDQVPRVQDQREAVAS